MRIFEDGTSYGHGYHRPQQYQDHHGPQSHPVENQGQGTEPVKEMRTYIREGTTIKEEYERLNPDGTVTKTVSVGDKKDGLKQFEVYKMDKSGIVRRVDPSQSETNISGINEHADPYAWMDKLRKMAMETSARSHKYKMPGEFQMAPSAAHGGRTGVQNEGKPYVRHQSIDDFTPEQKTAIFNRYREKLLNYGSDRLKVILQKKLNSEKANKAYQLSDEQKEELLDYGVKKLHKQLTKNLDEERFFREIRPMYENMMSDIPKEYANQEPHTGGVSFNLQPSDDSKLVEDSATQKPVTFVIRPEIKSKLFTEKATKSTEDVLRDRYKTFLNDVENGVQADEYNTTVRKPKTLSRTDDEELKQEGCRQFWKDLHSDRIKDYEDLYYEDKPQKKKEEKIRTVSQVDESLSDLENQLRQYVRDDKKSSETVKQKKEDLITYTMQGLKSMTNGGEPQQEERIKTKDEKHKKKYMDVSEIFDDDEIFEYGRKSLKKLIKKNGIEDKVNDDYEEDIRDSFSKQPKKTDDGYVILRPKAYSKLSNENKATQHIKETPVWDFNSFLNPFQEFFGKLKKPATETITSQLNPKDRISSSYGRSQQIDASKPEFSSEKESNKFDFNTFLSKCYDVLNERLKSSTNSHENQNNQDEVYYVSKPKEVSNNSESSYQDRVRKPVDLDSVMSNIRRKMAQHSSSEKYQQNEKNRISNLNQTQAYRDVKSRHENTFHQNARNGNTGFFQIHPQGFEKSSRQTSVDHNAGSKTFQSPSDDFVPWWFNQAYQPSSGDKPAFKDPIARNTSLLDDFADNPLVNGQFFSPLLANKIFKSMALPQS